MVRTKLSEFKTELDNFIEKFDRGGYCNVQGTGIYMTSNILETPIALRHNLDHNKVIHDNVIVLEIRFMTYPLVKEENRMEITDLGKGFSRVLVKYGYYEEVNIHKIIDKCREENLFDNPTEELSFFLARQTLINEIGGPFRKMEDSVFLFLRGFSEDATRYFKIPTKNVFEIGMQIRI